MVAATLGTVFHLWPTISPFLAPSKGPAAGEADFAGQIRLFPVAGHSVLETTTLGSTCTLQLQRLKLGTAAQSSLDQPQKEGVRAVGAGAKLGMELGGDEKGVAGQLDDLHQAVVGRNTANHVARLEEQAAVSVVNS
jgi:hypothetical protein